MWFRQLSVYYPEIHVVFGIFCGCVFFVLFVAIAVSLFSFIVIFLHAHTFLLTFCMYVCWKLCPKAFSLGS